MTESERSWLRRLSDPLIGPEATDAELMLGWGAAIVAALAETAWALVAQVWSPLQIALAVLLAFDIGGGVVVNATRSARRWWHRPGQGWLQHALFYVAHIHPLVIALLWQDYSWLQAFGLYLLMLLSASLVMETPDYLKRPVAYGLTAVGIVASLTFLRMPPGLEWLPFLYFIKLIAAHAVPDVETSTG